MKTVICSCFVLLLAGAGSLGAQPARRPNVIFFLIDDMGYADLSSFGSKDIRMPNIDGKIGHTRFKGQLRPSA